MDAFLEGSCLTTWKGHVLKAESQSEQLPRLVDQGLTCSQRPIVRLSIEVYLNHLTPTPWSQYSKNIPYIAPPPIGMDSAHKHLTMNDIVSAGLECESAQEHHSQLSPMGGYIFGLDSYLPFRSSICKSRLFGDSSGSICGLTSMPRTCLIRQMAERSLGKP